MHDCICYVLLQIAALRAEHGDLITNQQELEADYRRFAMECDMEEEHIVAKIQQARSAPQKNKRLQAIHEAHAAAASKEAELKAAESALQAHASAHKPTLMADQPQGVARVSPIRSAIARIRKSFGFLYEIVRTHMKGVVALLLMWVVIKTLFPVRRFSLPNEE